jgi:hypothetical protein
MLASMVRQELVVKRVPLATPDPRANKGPVGTRVQRERADQPVPRERQVKPA